MRRWAGVLVLSVLTAACGGSGDSTTPTSSASPTSVSPSSEVVPSTVVVDSTTTVPTTSPASSTTTVAASSTTATNSTPSSIAEELAQRPSLAGAITGFGPLALSPAQQLNDRDVLPRRDRIAVGEPDTEGMVRVTGDAGAVPVGFPDLPWDAVAVIALEWGTQACVDRAGDGSFEAWLEAPPGGTLYVMPIERGHCVGQGIQTGPAAVLSVPSDTHPGVVRTVGRAGASMRWSVEGSLDAAGSVLDFHPGGVSDDECLVPRIHLYRLFDADGGYVTQVNVNVHGPVLTPTGLPIESSRGPEGYHEAIEFLDAPECLRSDVALSTGPFPDSLEPGWFLPRIVFGQRHPDGRVEFDSATNLPRGDGVEFEGNTGFGFLPMVAVGTTAVPRLPATLLNEAPSWGSAGVRGVVAGEDAGRFALGSRRSVDAPFIASPTDPNSGQPVHYTLEPYLPTVGYTGFAAHLPEPLFVLDETEPGTLSVTLTDPEGTTRTLGSDATVEMFVSSAWFAGYPVELPFSGPSHTVGLTTRLDALDLEFESPGLHTVGLDGMLRSTRGDEFSIGGTYEIWVAEPLDLSLGVFEGTPLEVGDAWNPTVVVEPGVPAEIDIRITHHPDGDVDRREVHTISGTANRFGYFAAEQAWRPDEHGEYRAEVVARYVDPVDGTHWMGARSSASIVATPDSPLVAHGERNSQLARVLGDAVVRTWFFNRSADPACAEGACDPTVEEHGLDYPFFTGDVAWLLDGRPIVPSITVDGPAEVLAAVAPRLRTLEHCFPEDCVEVPDSRRLVSETAAGTGTHHRFDDVTSWAYWYSTSMRPDVSVFSAVAEGGGGQHIHWYGTDTYGCQIGLVCRDHYFMPPQGGRRGHDSKGDEEGDVKLLFGGAVLKGGGEAHFLPYASMAVLIEESSFDESGGATLGDDKGGRICPPYQGAAGGLGTCGPLLTLLGREVDLFITPTGTRPGSVLEPGDLFTFSGQAWPTLDVAVEVTVTGPTGERWQAVDRASRVGYVDGDGMSFVVEQPGIYEVHVSAVQDRPVPSTGLAPDPALVADGRTVLDVYGYEQPLSAILGSLDSTYRFSVVEGAATSSVTTHTTVVRGDPDGFSVFGWPGSYVEGITFEYVLPEGVLDGHYTLTAPGVVLDEGPLPPTGPLIIEVAQAALWEAGFTQVILGADTLQLSIAYEAADGWEAQILNQRGFSPLGGQSADTG